MLAQLAGAIPPSFAVSWRKQSRIHPEPGSPDSLLPQAYLLDYRLLVRCCADRLTSWALPG